MTSPFSILGETLPGAKQRRFSIIRRSSRRTSGRQSRMLNLEAVEVGYGHIKALKSVTMKVAEGQIVALLGANGAGKSTSLRAISGLLRPSGGGISMGAVRLDRLTPEQIVRQGVVQVLEGRRVFAGLTVLEILRLGAYCREGDLTADLERVYRYFPILGDRPKQAGGSLSGGEQQMLAIGRALILRPSCWSSRPGGDRRGDEGPQRCRALLSRPPGGPWRAMMLTPREARLCCYSIWL